MEPLGKREYGKCGNVEIVLENRHTNGVRIITDESEKTTYPGTCSECFEKVFVLVGVHFSLNKEPLTYHIQAWLREMARHTE